MLHLVDESLESFLRSEVPLPRDVDVSFDVPDETWGAGVSKPTLNLFLYDVRRNRERQHAGWTRGEDSGRQVRREPLHHVDCRYLVTVWASDTGDQHRLLGEVLSALLNTAVLAAQHLAGPLDQAGPAPVLSAAWPSEREPFEFWTALGGQLRPGIDLTVTLALGRRTLVETGPPVERVSDTVTNANRAGEPRQRVGGRSGQGSDRTRVWGRQGTSRVARDGSFLVPSESGEVIWVEEPEREAVVPDQGAIVIDGHDGEGRRSSSTGT